MTNNSGVLALLVNEGTRFELEVKDFSEITIGTKNNAGINGAFANESVNVVGNRSSLGDRELCGSKVGRVEILDIIYIFNGKIRLAVLGA